MGKDALIVFIKNPHRGKVKTRIAKTLGDDEALRIYNYLLNYTLQMCEDTEMLCYLYFSETVNDDVRWHSKNFKHKIQKGQDLGFRMGSALHEVGREHNKVVIIGSDCPFITPQIIYKAFAALDSTPLCIGPSTDGGYYLLGINFESIGSKRIQNRQAWALFENMEWSTETVLRETLERAQENNLAVTFLPHYFDIDTQLDWEKYLALQNKTVL